MVRRLYIGGKAGICIWSPTRGQRVMYRISRLPKAPPALLAQVSTVRDDGSLVMSDGLTVTDHTLLIPLSNDKAA